MKPTTTRERILLLILPALLVVTVYSWLLYPKQEAQQAGSGLQRAKANEPSLTEFSTRQMKLDKLKRDVERAKEQRQEQGSRRQAVLAQRSGGTSQLAVIQDLTVQFARHNLTLNEEGPAGSARLPAPLEQAVSRVADGSAPQRQAHTFWQLRFEGRYSDVLRMLDHLTETDHHAIPIQLFMEETQLETDRRTWTLVVWI